MAEKQPEGQPEIFPDAKIPSDAASPDHSPEETVPSAPSGQSKESSLKACPLLRDLNEDLVQSGKFIVTGKLDNIYRISSSFHSAVFNTKLLSLFICVKVLWIDSNVGWLLQKRTFLMRAIISMTLCSCYPVITPLPGNL